MTKSQEPHQIYQLKAFIENPNLTYLFLRGAGGTGKTYTISRFLKKFEYNHFQYLFIGPTGKSISVAEDKGMYGSTIHRFFRMQNYNNQIDINNHLINEFGSMEKYYSEMKKKLLEIKIVFIDEISMVNNQVLEHILVTLFNAAPKDIKIVLAGDYHQLSAVINLAKESNCTLDSSLEIIEEFITQREMPVVDFVTRYRSPNEDYNQWLHEFRQGKYTNARDIASALRGFFNAHHGQLDDQLQHKLTFIEHKNTRVTELNETLMQDLPGKTHVSTAKIIEDIYPPGQKKTRDRMVEDFQMDTVVKFKVGSKVLFRVNDPENKFKNGDEGIVESVDTEKQTVTIRKFDPNGEDYTIEVHKHLYKSGKLEKADGYNQIIEQLPFSLGNARTIHKSQGDGFGFIHFNFDFLNNGALLNQDKWQLLYVALSRVENPDGVWIHDSSLNLIANQMTLFKKINYDRLGLIFDNDQMIKQPYIKRI